MSNRPVEHYDFCIVGTGAAGGLLAYHLATAGFSVVSLEQGAPINDSDFTNELNPEQEANFGIAPDKPWPVYAPDAYFYDNVWANSLYASRDTSSTSPQSEAAFVNRQVFRLNGKQNLWGGVALRYSPRDFRGRDFGDSDVNWPIGYEELRPFYSAVERLIGVCGTAEGLAELPDGEFLPPMPLRPADEILLDALKSIRDVDIRAVPNRKAVETRHDVEHHCRSCGLCVYGCRSGSVYKFSSRLLPAIADRPNYCILYETKVVRLRRDTNSNRIAEADCLDTHRRERFAVTADVFVLAAGAMETPRILFNSRDDAFPHGLANESGLLGRFLQDNVKVVVGTSLRKLAGRKEPYDIGFGDHLLVPRFLFDNREFRGGYQAQYLHTLPKRPFYLDNFPPLPGRAQEWLARRLFRSYVALVFFGKPDVRRSNRLVPGAHLDAYGIPQVDVHYGWTENDRRMQASMVEYGRRILKKCTGLKVSTFVDDVPGNSIHYAGTCRMAAVPTDGVVDRNLRTFDHENLYVCDGSVMTEISEKNLTLTIMALADRLASWLVDQTRNST